MLKEKRESSSSITEIMNTSSSKIDQLIVKETMKSKFSNRKVVEDSEQIDNETHKRIDSIIQVKMLFSFTNLTFLQNI